MRCYREHNYAQSLRYSDLAVTKLKRRKAPAEKNSEALCCKVDALSMLGRYREMMECAKERYCMYLTKHTHPPAIKAGFCVIESCIHSKEFLDAVLYAQTTWETITLSRDSNLADTEREWFIAEGAYYLAQATWGLAKSGGMPLHEKPEAGREAIILAKRALKIHTQLHGSENIRTANNMGLLSGVSDYFNDVEDDEIIRLGEKAKAIHIRLIGSSTLNVAKCEINLGYAYHKKARRAYRAVKMDRYGLGIVALP